VLAEDRAGAAAAQREHALYLLSGVAAPTGAAARKAARWLTLAAEQGDAPAQSWLGTLYADGVGVAADPQAAIR